MTHLVSIKTNCWRLSSSSHWRVIWMRLRPCQSQSCGALLFWRRVQTISIVQLKQKNIGKAVESCTSMCFHLAQENVIIKSVYLTGQLWFILASKSHRYCTSISRGSWTSTLRTKSRKLILGVEAASEVFYSLSVSSNTFERIFFFFYNVPLPHLPLKSPSALLKKKAFSFHYD